MNILIGVISPAAIWVMPRHFVDQLRRDFPHHTFLEAWDRDTLRRLLAAGSIGEAEHLAAAYATAWHDSFFVRQVGRFRSLTPQQRAANASFIPAR